MSLQNEDRDVEPERRQDVGDIRLLASEVRHLAQELATDRIVRNREREEDRTADRERREKTDAQIKSLTDMILMPPNGLVHRIAAVEAAIPPDLNNKVEAATADRHNRRWRDRTIGAAAIVIIVKVAWDLVAK